MQGEKSTCNPFEIVAALLQIASLDFPSTTRRLHNHTNNAYKKNKNHHR